METFPLRSNTMPGRTYFEFLRFAVAETYEPRFFTANTNKPGTAQVGAISKAQKRTSKCQVFSSTVLTWRKFSNFF